MLFLHFLQKQTIYNQDQKAKDKDEGGSASQSREREKSAVLPISSASLNKQGKDWVEKEEEAAKFGFMVGLQSSSTTTSFTSGAVGGNGSNVLNAADLHSSAGESAEGRLSSGSRGFGASTSSGSEFNMESSDSQLLETSGNILSSQHSGIWR